jgi:aspartyl-tRNA(Asn)/glutamyl-tRNA(Gln) amidotransferase subunit A
VTGPSTPIVPGHVAHALDRIDPGSGAWITVTAEQAVSAARDAPAGPLAGLTFAVKDIIDTAGVRTTYGSPIYSDHVPVATASLVVLLEQAGAVCIGKTNLNEFAYGVSGYNPTYGLIRSPLGNQLSAGGSSGGSAAVVGAGVVDFAIGTDTSGSVRIPAACCGVYGFKTAHGSQPMDGVHPLAPSLDSVGFFTRDVPTLQRILGIERLPSLDRLRVRHVSELDLPGLPPAHWTIFRSQSYALHKERSQLYPSMYGRDLRVKLSQPIATDVSRARAAMTVWRLAYQDALRDVDVLAGPVFDGPAPTVEVMMREYESDSLATSDRLIKYTAVANALGWPAITVPTDNGPVHLMTRPGGEARLLACAAYIGLPT